MHDVLVSKEVNKQETPILVACNKSDLMTSTSAASIEKALARELCVMAVLLVRRNVELIHS